MQNQVMMLLVNDYGMSKRDARALVEKHVNLIERSAAVGSFAYYIAVEVLKAEECAQ